MGEENGYFYATRNEFLSRGYYYFVVMIYDRIDFEKDEHRYKVSVVDECGEISHSFTKNERKYEIRFSDCVKEDDSKRKRDLRLEIDECRVNLKEGNVFVIDFTDGKGEVKQSTFKLPIKDLSEGEAAENFANILKEYQAGELNLKSLDDGKKLEDDKKSE